MLSADEKPGVQARMRLHLPLPPGPGRAMRAEGEYARRGTLAYLPPTTSTAPASLAGASPPPG